jgi:hypothetical protein
VPHSTEIAGGIPSDIGVEAATSMTVDDIVAELTQALRWAKERADFSPIQDLLVSLKTERDAIALAVAANEVPPE